MDFYPYIADSDRWDGIDLVHDKDMDKFIPWRGKRQADHWTPVEVEVTRARLRKNWRRPVDFPSLSLGQPILSQRALDALHELIANHVEILPLACKTGHFYALNILTALDCLDEQRSQFDFIGEGHLWVHKYVLRERALHGEPIFRLTNDRTSRLISEDFRRIVDQHQLTGLIFEPVELTPVQ